MALPLRVLLIEDSEDDATLVLWALRDGGFQTTHARVCTDEGMRRALAEASWDVVISDNSMPGFNAQAALKRLQASNLDVPFIIVSGTIGEDEAVAAMRAGAHDYLIKDRLARLAPSVRREVLEATARRDALAVHRLADEALRQREQADAANLAKSKFLAVMSHELRTPLNAILGFSELLDDETVGSLNPRQKEYVGHVLTSTHHLLELINEVLDLSKIDAGRMELHCESVSPKVVATMVCESIMPLAEKRGVGLTVDMPALPAVWADRTRLRQMVFNLTTNAIKFTPRGGRVTLDGRVEGDFIVVQVRDTGIGISEPDLARLFGDFEQVTPTGEGPTEGTGLGLALTKRLVELHGGTITVQSAPGVGSTFELRLRPAPAPPLAALPDAGARAVASGEAPGSAATRARHILVVEDDPPSRRLLRAVLEQAGHEVSEATTLQEALHSLHDRPPDLVVSGIQFPGGGGELLLQHMRRDPALQSIPVLAATAHAMQGDPERFLAAGFDAYLSKPIDKNRLHALIETLVPQPPRAA